ncbi:hypothetical protein PhaeoP18_03823 (plasmid) [Phaeobacter piscinae]|uniref:Uncharacterized protein n=1 Tax=Phaeobacter piscinae TaxID=1580596 RepID=A0AAN1GUP6_9RHOB|nr:hypothetical protein PhaeoP13_03595 [Phaeobacter piscinae]AUR38039.1 hypothetical protein PhaeoP18_03823 [Phaeobacter piscinae]
MGRITPKRAVRSRHQWSGGRWSLHPCDAGYCRMAGYQRGCNQSAGFTLCESAVPRILTVAT